jgi:hypothetical protein
MSCGIAEEIRKLDSCQIETIGRSGEHTNCTQDQDENQGKDVRCGIVVPPLPRSAYWFCRIIVSSS